MSTKKILKFYLITTLSLSSLAVFSFNEEFSKYLSASYASVLDFQHVEKKPALAVTEDVNINENRNVADPFYGNNPAQMLFSIERKEGNSLVKAGAKNVNLMDLVFVIGPTKTKLKSFTLTFKGTNDENIKNAYLWHKKDLLATASISGNEIEFPNIGLELKPNTKITLPIKLDLGENLKVGEIISFNIEKPEDVNFEVGIRNYGLNGQYPINGGHLSIAKIR